MSVSSGRFEALTTLVVDVKALLNFSSDIYSRETEMGLAMNIQAKVLLNRPMNERRLGLRIDFPFSKKQVVLTILFRTNSHLAISIFSLVSLRRKYKKK